jgi:transposase
MELTPTIAFDWTSDRQWELKCLAQAGWTAKQIADRWGISRNAVLGRAHRTGVTFPKKVRPKVEKPPRTYKTSEEVRAAKSALFKRLHAEGRLGNKSRKSRQFRLEALALYYTGYSAEKVARIMGCYRISVYNWRKDDELVAQAKAIAERVLAERASAKAEIDHAEAQRLALIAEINAERVAVLYHLNPRLAVICRRYLAGERAEKIAEDIGVSRERVYQMLGKAKGSGVVMERLTRRPAGRSYPLHLLAARA